MSDDRNIWETLLREAIEAGAANQKRTAEDVATNIVLCGNKKNGKSAMLQKFQHRVTVKDAPEYILDYSYINIKNKHSDDTEEIRGQANVWQLDDVKHFALLDQVIAPNSLKQSAVVITIDLSKPWAILDTLKQWTDALTDASARWQADLSEEDQAALKLRISKAVQFYTGADKKAVPKVAPEEEKEEEKPTPEGKPRGRAGSKAPPPPGARRSSSAPPPPPPPPGARRASSAPPPPPASKEDAPAAVPAPAPAPAAELTDAEKAAVLNPELPAINLGFPVIVVGLKADFFQRQLSMAGSDDKFDFVLQRLRKECLKFGASLIYTSAVGDGTNIELTQDYLYHRIFNFPFTGASKVVGSSDDFGIFVPTGFDSETLISASNSSTSSWTDATPLSEVFGGPKAGKAEKAKEVQTVQAQDNVLFFKMLAQQLESGVGTAVVSKPRSASKPPPPAAKGNKKKQQKAVKSFFKSLLHEGGKDKKVKEDARAALGEMQKA